MSEAHCIETCCDHSRATTICTTYCKLLSDRSVHTSSEKFDEEYQIDERERTHKGDVLPANEQPTVRRRRRHTNKTASG